MTNYLDFFKTNSAENLKIAEITAAESELGIIFPPVFRAFYESFDLNIARPRGPRPLEFWDENHQTMSYFFKEYSGIEPELIVFQKLFFVNEIHAIMKSVYPIDHGIWNLNLIPIGECAFQGYLLLGTSGDTLDKIFLEFASEEPKIRYIAADIFSFFRNINIEADENILKLYNVHYSQLYKNWGEDFWRIRPNEADKT